MGLVQGLPQVQCRSGRSTRDDTCTLSPSAAPTAVTSIHLTQSSSLSSVFGTASLITFAFMSRPSKDVHPPISLSLPPSSSLQSSSRSRVDDGEHILVRLRAGDQIVRRPPDRLSHQLVHLPRVISHATCQHIHTCHVSIARHVCPSHATRHSGVAFPCRSRCTCARTARAPSQSRSGSTR